MAKFMVVVVQICYYLHRYFGIIKNVNNVTADETVQKDD